MLRWSPLLVPPRHKPESAGAVDCSSAIYKSGGATK